MEKYTDTCCSAPFEWSCTGWKKEIGKALGVNSKQMLPDRRIGTVIQLHRNPDPRELVRSLLQFHCNRHITRKLRATQIYGKSVVVSTLQLE